MFALIDDVDKLRGLTGPEKLRTFLRDCGLSDDEAETYSQFTPRLSDYRERLKQLSLGFDAIKALVDADQETVEHALIALEADQPIGATELEWLREIAKESKISDHKAEMDQRDQKLLDACLTLAKARLAAFENMASRLYDLMTQHSKQARYLIADENKFKDGLFLDDDKDEQTTDFYRRWPEIEAEGTALLKEIEQKIVPAAGDLLKEFDALFPGAMIPIEDWLDDEGSDPTPRNFAESRHALEALTRGGFLSGFPSIRSSQHQWNSFDAIAYLAGFRGESQTSTRLAPRPVKKLNAITIGAASGADAIGLDLAGFRVRRSYLSVPSGAETIKANRRDWTSSEKTIDDPAIVSDMRTSVGNDGTIDLLAGHLPGAAFAEKRRGEHDEAQRFTRAFAILAELKPGAFFFESSADFLELRHTGFRNRLIWQAGEMGYDFTDVVALDAKDFGIVQERKRSVFLGVRKKIGGSVQPLVLANPISRTVGETIADAAFPYLQKIETISPNERTVGQGKYLKWAKGWLGTHGRETTVPDALTLIEPRRSEEHDDKWRKDYGFLPGSDEIVEPHDNFTHVSVPLSISVLKRLQGIPDDWVLVGTYDEQVEQICHTIPPVISRVLAHNIHAAISGEIIDLNLAARMDIESNRWVKGFKFPSLASSSDPHAFRSKAWRRYLAGDDDS